MQEYWLTAYLASDLGKLWQVDSLGIAAAIQSRCVFTDIKKGTFQAILFALRTYLPTCSPAIHHCLHSEINVLTPACQQSNSFNLL